jgi:hypothetical protein
MIELYLTWTAACWVFALMLIADGAAAEPRRPKWLEHHDQRHHDRLDDDDRGSP